MFNLKTAITELQNENLSEKALKAEIQRLLSETMKDLDEYAKAVTSIKTAFSYKNLSSLINAAENMNFKEAEPVYSPILSSLKGLSKTIRVDEHEIKPDPEIRLVGGVKARQVTQSPLPTIEEGDELEEDVEDSLTSDDESGKCNSFGWQ
jgi:DNA gyrase/topoisomerase IV subunit A